ncbi:F-box/FBD/LRR-repeat protein At5g22660-like [Lolium rigidum]|uniref:F-box/FBD/LRR-repeat protein At5g22660-like n=1 Tax=Lolium rigidum TaxID=89674 RepID=UPI001F5DABA1|nr:F-box/FBD/LRR-repeat protein At5g22660-like [Lolium rigidum]XP_047076072.1 F-box/FBD/LRR-repeat protein At5g22660-like [Lolium rigidum]
MSADEARQMFEGMLISPPPVSGADRISALPDNVLQDILSLLTAQEAVRTCVLARSWRHLWRSITSLRILSPDTTWYESDDPEPARDLWKFVDNLLNLRDKRTELHTLDIKFGQFSKEDLPYVSLWIRSAVMCKVSSLTFHHIGPYLCLDDLHLASRHLRTVHLASVALLKDSFVDFASCPALEDFKLHECKICFLGISSTSLKHLSITGCIFGHDSHSRLHVSAPSLASLKLDDLIGIAPIFENMLLLEMACVSLGNQGADVCCNVFMSGILCRADNACPICADYPADYVLLAAISSARHLELISKPENGPDHKIEMKGSYRTMEGPPAISEHLKIVEVKCNAVDEKILEVLKFLRAFNIRFGSE